MKTFKIKSKRLRRFLRVLLTLFTLWFLWSIYYFTTWTKFPEAATYPMNQGVSDTVYAAPIQQATAHLKGISKRLNVPSFSVAVGHQGKLIWSASEGFATVETGKAATPLTQYRMGSTSKAITATGVARLVDRGQLDLEAIIGDSITNWDRKEWDFSMKQLLSHTAGVGNYEDFGLHSAQFTLCNCNQFESAAEGITVFNRYDLLYEPGTRFQYSSFDVNLASVVLEQAADRPFLDYMQAMVFDPLQMQHTYADHSRPKSEHFATFYQTEDDYYREYRTMGIKHDVNLSYKWAGGGFISTPTDLVKMGNAYLGDPSFLSASTKQEFWTPVRLENGNINEQEYALGWRSWPTYENELLLDGETPIWMVHHGGVSKGSMNFLVLFPNYGLVIDASINSRAATFGEFAAEVRQLADFFLRAVPKEEWERYSAIQEVVSH
ncbi:serine hydrolase domain-containing protein [Flagellimonas sp. DF-77]|uniref:serine hydrolase domain-containing protein n=1 Tax=Flagellimonas algarum TaxID=3230298 RepID=UPI003394633E